MNDPTEDNWKEYFQQMEEQNKIMRDHLKEKDSLINLLEMRVKKLEAGESE